MLVDSTGTSFLHQEETPQPLDAIPFNQAKPPSPETSNQDIFHETSSDPATLLVDVTKESKEGEKEKEVLKETIDNPLQGETEVFPKDADERSLPSPPKSIPKASTRLDKLKKVVREEEVDANYFFKFMDDYICKPLERGFEDIVQCQSNLQEIQMQGQKQLSDLELKVDSASTNSQTQI